MPRWRAEEDEHTCEACSERAGTHVTGAELGATGARSGPPHPGCTNPDGCRCTLIADEDIAAGVNHLLRVELLEESGDPSITATPRIVPAHPPAGGIRISEEEWRGAGRPILGSGFLGGPIEPMVPPALWRIVLELVLQAIKRWRWRLSENWDHARRIANAKEVDRRRNANRD